MSSSKNEEVKTDAWLGQNDMVSFLITSIFHIDFSIYCKSTSGQKFQLVCNILKSTLKRELYEFLCHEVDIHCFKENTSLFLHKITLDSIWLFIT